MMNMITGTAMGTTTVMIMASASATLGTIMGTLTVGERFSTGGLSQGWSEGRS
jgi:hypothetical protein